MLQHVGEINSAVKGISTIIGTQRPFVGFLVNNWPLTLIGGAVLWSRLRERHQKKTLSAFNVATDSGLVLAPLIGIALINLMTAKTEQAAAAAPAMNADYYREAANSPIPGT